MQKEAKGGKKEPQAPGEVPAAAGTPDSFGPGKVARGPGGTKEVGELDQEDASKIKKSIKPKQQSVFFDPEVRPCWAAVTALSHPPPS